MDSLSPKPDVPRQREENDAYYTHPILARTLVGALDLTPGRVVIEPSVGGGAFARPLCERGMVVVGIDLDPDAPGRLDCHRFLRYDFTRIPPLPVAVHAAVGNPPYGDAPAHLRTALSRVDAEGGIVAFLLRLSFLADTRERRLEDTPLRRVLVVHPRPSYLDRHGNPIQTVSKRTGKKTTGADNSEYGWFIWERGYTGRPELGWVRWERPSRRRPLIPNP